MRTLIQSLRPHRGLLLTSVLLAILASLLELVPHALVYLAALRVFADPPALAGLTSLAALAFAAVTARYLLTGGSLVISHAVAFRVLRGLRERMIAKLAKIPLGVLERKSPGDLKKALVEDIDALENVVAHQLTELASALLVPLAGVIVLLTVDWRMAVASVALLPLAVLIMAISMRDVGEQMSAWHAAERRANVAILEFFRGIVVLKAHDRDASSMSRVRGSVLAIRDLATSMTRRTAIGYMAFFTLLSSNLVVVLPVGVALHRAGELSRPDLVLFLLLGFGLTAALLKLLFLFSDLQMNKVRWARIQSLLEAPEIDREGAPAFDPEATQEISLETTLDTTLEKQPESTELRFEHLSFSYATDRGPALQDLSFTAPAGSITAIVGPSGAGKTTLAQLIAGTRRPSEGRASIGDVEIATLSAAQRRELITVIAQQAHLFHGTLRDNLRLARPAASDAELEQVARAAALLPMIEQLPRGWDTLVGERGASLSGGEAQRVAIARALLRDTPVVVLDEVTAKLDAHSERAVQQALGALLHGRTVVVIAHRLRTVATADRIVVLDAGRLVDQGSHRELVERCPLYQRMWTAQEAAGRWRIHAAAPTNAKQVLS
ncbi:ABC transporter ATP-binding protein [Pseudenhygromyxa sp. WMMC2535]|uniref:ABC transporter ATP-binding protein n=1 Tax=Pseudenhygromyxa sp. WMMC2535 TaxID=2712867 RepID=UPI0015521251|nr:ABC transporter ATP-binding protein [Pseudenhygromyxa sp. WMMC2535]NVB42001.1 ABC transporter ATP-binding protein [Pseudenhygromyxa sp. WMMC2535]